MRSLLIAVTLLASTLAAEAQQCADLWQKSSFAELQVSRVTAGSERLPFTLADCALTKPGACRSKAFVMPGDVVLVGQVFDASACAAFVNTMGQVTTGLLPNNRLESVRPLPRSVPAELVGTWKRTEAEIVVKPKGRDGMLAFAGNATYGAFDKGRVARGAVNLGEFSFDMKPASNAVAVALTTNKTGDTVAVAQDTGDATDCAVAMIALGPYLAVEDNRNCGGHNVSFTGLYRRAK